MARRNLFLIITLISVSLGTLAQDTLPDFSVINPGNDRIIISWTNPYANTIRQLSIQRSFDSLRNYKTILTLPDPTVAQNGYVDSKATTNNMFYRLYILRDSGKFIFSVSKRPVLDTAGNRADLKDGTLENQPSQIVVMNKVKQLKEEARQKNERVIFIKSKDLLLGALPESSLKHFKDSINFLTKDTIFMKTADTLVIKPFVPKEYYRPSKFVYAEKDGNIKIALSEAATKMYSIIFFEEDKTEIFELKRVKDPLVILDKSNFVHAGWFLFELYEDGKLKERHKFYVPKDF